MSSEKSQLTGKSLFCAYTSPQGQVHGLTPDKRDCASRSILTVQKKPAELPNDSRAPHPQLRRQPRAGQTTA